MPTPEKATQTMIANFPAKTGKALGEWLAIVREARLERHGEIVRYLKSAHGMTYGFANLAALTFLSSGGVAKTDLVKEQYAGRKAALRLIYDAVLSAVGTFGTDVEVSPKKSYVSLRRQKQFAIIQPTTGDRVDLGLNLPGRQPAGRLEASGSFNSMVTHRVRLTKVTDVDRQVVEWLRRAYSGA